MIIKHELTIAGKHQKAITFDIRWEDDNSSSAKPVILFIHGFKGFKDWGYFILIADYFASHGFVYCKMNLSHNGTSPENLEDTHDLEAFAQNNFSIELDDVAVMLDYLTSNNSILQMTRAISEELYVIGHSRGGALALLKAGEDSRIKKVVTWAAIHDLSKRWPKAFIDDWKKKGITYVPNKRTGQQMPLHYQLVEDVLNNPERLSVEQKIKAMKQPLLVIHGTADETLDMKMAKKIASWHHDANTLIIDGANHVFGGKHPYSDAQLPPHSLQICEASLAFLKKESQS